MRSEPSDTSPAHGRRLLSPRRAWLWVLVAVVLLAVGAVVRDLTLTVGGWDLGRDVTPGWAYLLCALLVFADGVCALFPAETTLITASALAVQGILELPLVILAGAVGAVTGDSALYWLARVNRRRLQSQVDKAMRNETIADAMDLIGTRAPLLLVVGRYVPGLRFVVNASCGLATYPYPRFLLWSSIGGTLWSVVTCLTAFALGTVLEDNPLAALVLSSLVSTTAVAVIFILLRRHHAARTARSSSA